ncbi:CpsB/CapC family capsule biosynthesis tyrosine phosphatase [uncultured Alistipes sp.]|uniref:tyrosine-protein phosphatase n=1 Tax=uncultured Alistipes sp. TaxID=538949 RepID=UPI002628A526|nr:CpsB/CapC family capsule biosynthesis tyrosine phosphatase [uncultured Alistipes sp.]
MEIPWPFGKRRTLVEAGFFRGFTDWHSHILPGVDDGVRTMPEALEILRRYEELGVRSVWLTPHIMEDIPNETSALRERFKALQAAYAGPVELHLAAENMLDTLFEERLERNDLLPLGEKGDHLLVETSYFNPPMDLYGILERIKASGYHPLLAHPERYVYMSDRDYRKLKALGIKFQLDLFSLGDRYGKRAKDKARLMLQNDLYDIAGSDLHRVDHIRGFWHIPVPARSSRFSSSSSLL